MLGVELKKRIDQDVGCYSMIRILSETSFRSPAQIANCQALRQAEAEFYLWANGSQFPFAQLLTDMEVSSVSKCCDKVVGTGRARGPSAESFH